MAGGRILAAVTTRRDPRSTVVIWDYDGTLVDSREKNLRVNRAIVGRITGRPSEQWEVLSSLTAYDRAWTRNANWREIYGREFGFSEDEIDRAGRLWNELQSLDPATPPVFDGIAEALERLAHLPHGVVSQNGRANIRSGLERGGISDHFDVVIGYEEVDSARQKPHPEGLLRCFETLGGSNPGRLIFVGDHETDALCAERARQELGRLEKDVEVVSIAAFYGVEPLVAWRVAPTHVVHRPAEVSEIVRSYAPG